MPGLKLYYGLDNSKRPEVISRLMQGQLNFLPLRTGTIHSSLQPSLVLISHSRHNQETRSRGFSLIILRPWPTGPDCLRQTCSILCMCVCVHIDKHRRRTGVVVLVVVVVTWKSPESVVTLWGSGQGMDHFLTTIWRRKHNMSTTETIVRGKKDFEGVY